MRQPLIAFATLACLIGTFPGLKGAEDSSKLEAAPGRNQRQIERIATATTQYPLRFVFTADTEFDPRFSALRQPMFQAIAALKEPPRFVMVAGDFAGPGTEVRHREHIAEADRLLPMPNLTAVGNHDLDIGLQEGLERFRTIHGPENYSFSLGNTFFAVITSAYGNALAPGALDWLDRALAADNRPVKLVMMHIPPHMDGHFAPHAEWSFQSDEARFFEVLRRHRVNLLCCGHWVGFDVCTHEGLPVVTSAGGCVLQPPELHQPPQRTSYAHFVEFSIEENGVIHMRMAHERNNWQFDPQFDHTFTVPPAPSR